MALIKIEPYIIDATGDFTFNNVTATGNLSSLNANLGNAATANYFTGTLTSNAQPNITSIGNLIGLTVSNSSSTVNFITTANVSLGAVANLHITGGTSGQYLQTDGSGVLSWATVTSGSTSNISNGNSNVNIPAANGNINFTSVGNTTMVITGTGANIAGTANITGNLTAGNANLGNSVTANYFVGALYGTANLATYATTANSVAGANVSGQVGNSLVAGTVYTNAQPNITSVGSLTGLTVSNATGVVNFTTTANVTLGAVANLHITGGTNAYVLSTDGAGNLSWVAQSSGGGANISNGNSNVNIPSANGNVNISAVGNANVVVVTGTGANITGTANVTGNLSAGNIIAGSGTGGSITGGNLVSANYITGTLTTAAQPNITSVGTLTSLGVNGTVTAVAFTANTGVFTGNGNGLSSIVGANVTGQVANALVAGTVYTNAQPNITSIGSLTGLTVSNSTGVVNFTTTANVTLGAVGNLHITGGTNAYVLSTDGAGNLSWVAQSSGGGANISNGNSNVNIPAANGNVNISAVGNANIVVVTGTGANINGTLNTTGNVTLSGANVSLGAVGNLHITGGTNAYVLSTDGSGNLSWVAQSGGNAANIIVDSFTGNGVQTVFTLSTTPGNINQTSINYNGATILRSDYTLANANITFSSAPANGSLIEVTTTNLTAGGGGGGSALTIQDEGTTLTTTATLINFVGNGIAATNVGDNVTVTVNSSGATSARAVGYSLIFGG